MPEQDRARLRSRYGERIVVAVARLVHYKGLDVLIEAARSLDASVVIIGDGPLAEALSRRARNVANVHLIGAVDEAELRCHLAVADCFALPSTNRAESFGIATLEAQAMGVPAVVTDVGTGTVEAVSPGETGLVVAPGDAAALAGAIGTNPHRSRGARCRCRVARARVRFSAIRCRVPPSSCVRSMRAPPPPEQGPWRASSPSTGDAGQLFDQLRGAFSERAPAQWRDGFSSVLASLVCDCRAVRRRPIWAASWLTSPGAT